MKKSQLFFTVILVPLDFLMLVLAAVSAYALRTSEFVSNLRPVLFFEHLPFERYMSLSLEVAPFWILIFALLGLYKVNRKKMLEEFFQIISAVSLAMMAVIVYIFLQSEQFDSRFIILAVWFFSILYLTLGRLLVRKIQKYLMVKFDIGAYKAIVIGSDKISEMLARQMKQKPALGFRVVNKISNFDLNYIKKIVLEKGIDTVVVGQSDYPAYDMVDLAEFCQENRVNFRFAPTLFQSLTTNINVDTLSGIQLMELKYTPLDGWGRVIKRTVDIFGSVFGIVVLFPFFVVLGIIIKLDSKGPVFVRLKRVTQGKEFYLYKFRSMVDGAEKMKKDLIKNNERKDGPLFKIKNDPRITRVGRFIRKTRIDELPQLFNVFLGQMSLVGPRPHQPDEVAQYERRHKKVLAIKAGMTGMAQVSGSSDLPFEEEIKLDLYYIENWSLFLDIKILLRTFLILFKDKSAC